MHPGRCLRNSLTGRRAVPSLLVLILFALAFAAVRYRDSKPVATPAATALQHELSMVQIEQMRVLAPDEGRAAELGRREEQLKYALLAGAGRCPGTPPAVPACVSSSSRLLRGQARCAP